MAETFNTGVLTGAPIVPEQPLFGAVLKVTLDRTFDPVMSQVERNFKFSFQRDPNYDFKKYLTGQYADYGDEFAALPNDQAALNLRAQIDRSFKTRQVLAEATTGQALGAGLFDPVNYLGLQFGGPLRSIGTAALRSGVSVAAVETGREAVIQATDPVATYEESALNIASSALFGAAFGAATSIPAVKRAQALETAQKYIGDFARLQRENETASGITPEMFSARLPREQRPFAGLDNAAIEAEMKTRLGEAEALRAQAGTDEGAQALRDQADAIEAEVRGHREELGLRSFEDAGFDVNDPYGIPANWYTDSVFYKAITNPMKRALQSKVIPTPVKKAFVDLADDMSLALNRNRFGIASEPSVHLRTAVSSGELVKIESSLKKLYGEVQQNPMKFDEWIESVSRKRLMQDPNMSEAELKAASVIEEYYGGATTENLETLGLITTGRGRENRIRIINEEIDGLLAQRDGADPRAVEVIDARVEALRKDGDIITRMVLMPEDRIAEFGQALTDITAWNKRWMQKQINYINSKTADSRKILADLNATAEIRGLTKKQLKLQQDLESRIKSADESLAYYNGLTEKINAAKTVDDLMAIRKELDVTEKMADAMDTLSTAIEELRAKIDRANSVIEAQKMEPPKEPFFPRFYKVEKIRKNREAFTKILMREFEKNPYVWDYDAATGDYVRVKLSTDPVKLRERAESTVNKILGETDPVGSGDVVPGLGRSKHFRGRSLDIPTSAIMDYIELNPVSVLNSYNARVRPRALFQEKFGKDYRGVTTQMELDMIKAGASEADINAVRRDFDVLYRRIVSNVLDNPDAINQKVASVLRSGATFAFMGGAGLSSLSDFGRVVMQYDLAPMLDGIRSTIDMDTIRMSGRETQLAGSAMEYTLGLYRLDAQRSNNLVESKLLNSAQHAFYILNGLTPLTIAFKKLSGLVMGHTIIDSAIKLADGTISDADRLMLMKHGISEEMARRIAKAPWQRNKEGLILPNTEQWADHIEIPEISTGTPIPVKLNVKQMSDAELGAVFDWLAQETKRNEKVSNKEDWTDAEKAANESGDWRKFSKLRGYTDAQIAEFDQWIEVANEYIARFGVDNAASRSEAIGKSGKIKPEVLNNVTFERVTVIEANEDGTPVGFTDSNGNYVPARYNRETNTIFFDRDYIEGPMFERKAWLKPRKEGVKPLPDIFKTPRQWANFVMLHEINYSRFGIDDVEFDVPKPAAGFTRIYRFAVKNQERGKVSEWVAQSEDYQNMLKATGRWFSDDFDEAMWYVKENPEGELLYVDVPTKDVEGYRVSNIVETSDGLRPKDFSARAEKELFVPREVADAAESFSTLRTIGYENKINELALADFKAAKKISDKDVEGFRVAINSGITNTVIHGTPADRPIITDGVVHIPMSIASKFGLQEDKFLKGYARIENGLLALPFQFYNFMFGSVNKTLATVAHGQVKNRAVGVATMLGLAYMIQKIKTKDSTWESMSFQDKMARTIDASGILPFYSDLFYRTMHSTIALGGPNITGGFISPKFKQRVNPLDVVTDIAGAGPSWGANIAEGLFKVANGNYGEGASDILRMMPMANMWFLKSEVSELAQAMRQ